MEKVIYTDDLTGVDIWPESGFEVRFLDGYEPAVYLHAQSEASIIEQLLTGPNGEDTKQHLIEHGILIITQAEVEALMEGMLPPGIEASTVLGPEQQLKLMGTFGPSIPEDAGPYNEDDDVCFPGCCDGSDGFCG